MYDKELAKKLKKILQEYIGNELKAKELASLAKVDKNKRKDVIHTLNKLRKNGEIGYNNHRYFIPKKAPANKQLIGTFDARPLAKNKSFAFVICPDYDVYISSEDTLNAFHNDTVQIDIKYTRKHKKYGIVTKIVKRFKEHFVGNVSKYKGRYYLLPDNHRIHSDFEIKKLNNASSGQKVILKVLYWGDRHLNKLPYGEVSEILGKAGEPEVETLAVIKDYNLPLTFPEAVIQELKDIEPEIRQQDYENRQDFRDLPTFTIDPASAKDYDDAISLIKNKEKWELYVHIADVTHYIHPQSQLFAEAVNRGNSYYFPQRVIPMLPEKISNKICSLRPYEDKLTLTVKTVMNNDFKILNQNVYESVICSDARFSYAEIDDLFEGKQTDIEPELADTLKNMRKLSQYLSKQRIKEGYLNFNLPETEYIFDDEGHIIDLQRSRETDSHKLIENFMVLANEFIAKKLSHKPTIYRVHEDPDEDRLYELQQLLKFYRIKMKLNDDLNRCLQNTLEKMPNAKYHRVFDRMILRSMKKAHYDIKNRGHFALAMNNYTHFTSPIRRLCDLIIHHQIKSVLSQQNDFFSKKDLAEYADTASEKELVADESEREIDLKNKIKFMKSKVGETYKGMIISVLPKSLIVELERYPVTGIVDITNLKDDYYVFYDKNMSFSGRSSGKSYKLMDELEVTVARVEDDIYFQPIVKE
ncbi:MAG TPA: ribonuclease R [Candidatus Cloacimonas sp.]|jgi:ribonuclease R|nr:ribonuclease [Candidatus Cloacimonadota bacterium]HCX73311.1 ribonuclease R [Candidatus Cloacimonas sp.]